MINCGDCCLFSCGGATVYDKGFPKRLLVAVSVVLIIAMFVTPVDARSIEHKRRHQRRPEGLTQLTKEESVKRTRNPNTESYKNVTRKIKHKLRNTKRFFDQGRKVLNETREYSDGMPTWLPAVSFVDIHFHDYRTSARGRSMTERKFTYLMPKLYKTLKEYEVIFKILLNVQLDFYDEPFTNYIIVRTRLLTNTLNKLASTIAEIEESMMEVSMPVPRFDVNRMKLDTLDRKVDATQCIKNDYIAFRGYGNFLNNWYSEFRCPLSKKGDRKCAVFHSKMKQKLDNKRGKNNRSNVSMMR
ncbi:uncharacterized protein LOC116769856 isoform X1 [Danaus plexippus]|uniref:uncharacterized protein LOC116769856 isoform X1 n=1 Tax=Danaus plexippus TaxID=13037 RepID=UPI002AB0BB41|nr:uncharacterized protein LOC116769856 isoform X1 [Danaus plexippus]